MRPLSIVFLALSLQAADPIVQQHFIAGTEGWVTNTPGALGASEGSLTLSYEAGSTPRAIAGLPVKNIPFAEMKSLRFEVKTDSAFALALILGEKKPGGGNYSSVVWSNGGAWRPVVLTPADFTVGDGPNDPVDSDGRLDLDQVENIALFDFSSLLAAFSRDSEIYVEPHAGHHTISIRNFEILRDPPPGPVRPQADWFSPGGAAFEKMNDAIVIHYRQTSDAFTSFHHMMPPSDASGAKYLAMDIQSDRDAQLAISFKDAHTRFNIDFFVPAGKSLEHREVLLSAFDSSGRAPDPATIHALTLLEVTPDAGPNRLIIRNLRFSK